uniref:Importin subunit alpha-1-like n=1 Tax=Nicotiana tabacum TaxID=4097 RepID=A0A1S4ASM0_TOBAC|nr:PREDICTED: importin subunit alpha-1-like [Nicotiana tabacum]
MSMVTRGAAKRLRKLSKDPEADYDELDVPSIVDVLKYGDCDLMKLLAIKQLQKLFDYEDARDSGELVPLPNEILGREDLSKLKSEAAKAVIYSIPELLELTDLVIENKLVETLLKLLHFPDGNVCKQAVEKLGKVAQSVVGRDYALIECGALDILLEILNNTNEISMLRKASWTLSKFCGGRPKPHFEKVKPAFPTLRNLLTSNVDEEVLKNACWPPEETALVGSSRLQLTTVRQHLEALHPDITDDTPELHIHRQMCRASMGTQRNVTGFLPLLQLQPPLPPLAPDAPPPFLPLARRWVDRRGYGREYEARMTSAPWQ